MVTEATGQEHLESGKAMPAIFELAYGKRADGITLMYILLGSMPFFEYRSMILKPCSHHTTKVKRQFLFADGLEADADTRGHTCLYSMASNIVGSHLVNGGLCVVGKVSITLC